VQTWLMPCYRCGRVQTDPARGPSAWARGVVGREQVLVCPECQSAEEQWSRSFETCRDCGSSRLSLVLGSIVCRACGRDRPL
jgi:hypothetical protein